MRQITIVAASALLLFTSCREIFAKRVRGNGNVVTQNRSAGQFNSIDVGGSIDVYVKQDSTSSIKVETDDNLQQFVETIEDGGVLRIKTTMGYNLNPSRAIKVYVSAASFKSLEASGACNIVGDGTIKSASTIEFGLSGSCNATVNVEAPKVSVDASGACTISLKGATKDFNVQGSGSTDVKCFDLMAENVYLDLSGAGDAEVYASVKLNGSLSGSADVSYKGAAQTDVSTSGASSVKKVN